MVSERPNTPISHDVVRPRRRAIFGRATSGANGHNIGNKLTTPLLYDPSGTIPEAPIVSDIEPVTSYRGADVLRLSGGVPGQPMECGWRPGSQRKKASTGKRAAESPSKQSSSSPSPRADRSCGWSAPKQARSPTVRIPEWTRRTAAVLTSSGLWPNKSACDTLPAPHTIPDRSDPIALIRSLWGPIAQLG